MSSARRRARTSRHVVAGAAGFLGSHLVDYLLARGETVVGIDNLITGQPRNLAAAMENPRFHFIQHNVSEPFFLVEPVRYVWHLASPASPPDYFKNPIHTMKVGALGTLNLLGIARKHGARFFLASTSEVYGDPEVSPQPEAYWGRVNPIGPRSVYDEAKRFAEALTMAYHREHGVDTRIVRIFNSVLADETIFLFNDAACHLQSAESYANSLEARKVWAPLHIQVPAFDPATCAVQLRPASAFIKHPAVAKDAYLVRTRYGRHIKVTGDHSLFKRDRHGRPAATPVRELVPGDYVAIPSRLPVVERDVRSINVGQWLLHTTPDHERLSGYVLISPRLPETIVRHKALVYDTLMRSARFEGSRRRRNTVGCAYRKYLRRGALPLAVVAELQRQVGFEWPSDARLARYTGGGSATIPNLVEVSDELLWLLGFYLAEGCCYTRNGAHLLTFCSDERFLLRAKALLE